jgi:diaminopimelate epimerase
MKIPFTKAHGARNDFLITASGEVPEGVDAEKLARAICDRHTGVGADGWIVISPSQEADAAIELWNSDGSRSELSGNGTRCAALYLVEHGCAAESLRIMTGAGLKRLELLQRQDREFTFEMTMGRVNVEELRTTLTFEQNAYDATILNVGNPQCVVFTADFEFDWRAVGAWIERHPRFPHRTNVSFVRVVDQNAIEVRFWERGAGETMSSGTGSTGAAAASVARGVARSPVEVRTPAGALLVRWQDADIFLAGPAEIVASGDFYF